jgi:hypothetical protein
VRGDTYSVVSLRKSSPQSLRTETQEFITVFIRTLSLDNIMNQLDPTNTHATDFSQEILAIMVLFSKY